MYKNEENISFKFNEFSQIEGPHVTSIQTKKIKNKTSQKPSSSLLLVIPLIMVATLLTHNIIFFFLPVFVLHSTNIIQYNEIILYAHFCVLFCHTIMYLFIVWMNI